MISKLKLIFADLIISLVILGIVFKFVKSLNIKIFGCLTVIVFIITSLLINFNQYLYFASTFAIGYILIAIFIKMKFKINPGEDTIVWLAYIVSVVVLLSIIMTKKFVIDNLYTQPMTGDKGKQGVKGNNGTGYFMKSYQERSYNEIILHIEEYLKQNKEFNNIPFEEEPHLKNLYFKDIIKRVIYSQEYGDYVFKGNDKCETGGNRGNPRYRRCEISKIPCDSDLDCLRNSDSESRYNQITDYLKKVFLEYIKIILKNTDKQDTIIENNNLSYLNSIMQQCGNEKSTRSESKTTVTSSIESNKYYNNKFGHQFLNDYFLTCKFFDRRQVKRYLDNNPIDEIKNKEFNGNISNSKNPFDWGTCESNKK